jgi:predicted permease
MAPAGLLQSFLAAIQASLSVLLVIFYGGLAAKLNILDEKSSKGISKICVRMFLPALTIVKIGTELEAGSASRYGIVLLWALLCHFISFLIGIFAHLFLGMPDWTTVAVMVSTWRLLYFLSESVIKIFLVNNY